MKRITLYSPSYDRLWFKDGTEMYHTAFFAMQSSIKNDVTIWFSGMMNVMMVMAKVHSKTQLNLL